MSQQLVLEVNDQIFRALEERAAAMGTSPIQAALAALEENLAGKNGQQQPWRRRTEAEQQAARERYERHFGTLHLRSAHGSDNESIDADLAREYLDNHEGE